MPAFDPPFGLSHDEWQRLSASLRLSPREEQIIQLASYDESTSHMAAQLRISPNTVHTYRERLFRKLGVRSCTQAIGKAFAEHVAIERQRRTRNGSTIGAGDSNHAAGIQSVPLAADTRSADL